jgi:hypothetical protein
MDNIAKEFSELVIEKGLKPYTNPERPTYVQPEDLIKYRAARLVVILGMLNTVNGLSKEVIACIDFLLRNPGYQKRFIIEYFKEKKVLWNKLQLHSHSELLEFDFNIIRYKSVPWDLRFNDMFLLLFITRNIEFIGEKSNRRARLSAKGQEYFSRLEIVFGAEVNFLEVFGKKITEAKAISIITEVIPETFWKENDNLIY